MRKIISIILILILVFCSFKIAYKLYEYNHDKNQYNDIKSLKPKVEIKKENQDSDSSKKIKNTNSNNKNDKKDDNSDTLKDIKNINQDYKFWITVDNTSIDYPVVQGTDNEYYLHHNFKKEDSISGAIFIDYRVESNDKNTIIYGHNMKNKTMFQSLNSFLQRGFFESNNKIHILEDGIQKDYEVFSVHVTTEAENYLITSFGSDKEFNEYIKTVKGESMYKDTIPVSKDDNIITLATCSNELGDSRILIHAKQIK